MFILHKNNHLVNTSFSALSKGGILVNVLWWIFLLKTVAQICYDLLKVLIFLYYSGKAQSNSNMGIGILRQKKTTA